MGWPEVELKRVVQIRTGSISPFSHPEQVFELYSIPGFDSGAPEIFKGIEIRSNKTKIEPGDVLFSKLNPRIPRVWIVGSFRERSQISSTEFWPLICDTDQIDRRFLRHLLLWPAFRERFSGGTEAATKSRSRIKPFQLLGQKIPLPAVSEQRRIVEILDQADALRKKRAEGDAKAARVLPALFYKMFGDPTTNPKGWRIKPLSDFEAQVRYGLGQPPKASETGIALIRATNISRGTISTTNMIYVDPQDVPHGRNAFLKEDEVIVVRSGAYTGDIAQVTKEWEGCVAGYDLVITPGESLTGEFVEAYLLTSFIQKGYFQNLKARAGQPHLNAAQVSATPVLDVPRDLQVQFSEVVQSMRILRKQWVAASENLEKAFAVLLHRAFTGDLTAKWREAHMKELLAEMKVQEKYLEAELC